MEEGRKRIVHRLIPGSTVLLLLCPAARFPNCPAAAPLAEKRSNGLLNYAGQFGKLKARPDWAQQ
jgi:hypothetical protein